MVLDTERRWLHARGLLGGNGQTGDEVSGHKTAGWGRGCLLRWGTLHKQQALREEDEFTVGHVLEGLLEYLN